MRRALCSLVALGRAPRAGRPALRKSRTRRDVAPVQDWREASLAAPSYL